ncbi:DUF3017 domain-containing protein [Nocardioides sp.]|uniref:DUF3017 domain-containing protein n=1 Tax=Nocardioides sp. TaxID=35761 RepID=UPI002ED00E54
MTVSETEAPLPAEGDADQPRRYPSTIGGALYLLALAAVVAGIGVTALDGWRNGIRWIGGALVFAAACRLLVPRSQAGMLAVRNRWIDVLMLAWVGGLLLFLAASIPDQPL